MERSIYIGKAGGDAWNSKHPAQSNADNNRNVCLLTNS